MGNEEEEDDASNNNEPPPRDNTNVGNFSVDNNNAKNKNVANANSNILNPPKNKKARLAAELTNYIKRIIPPKFNSTTFGDGVDNCLNEMENYFAIRNFSEETKVVSGAYHLSHEAFS
ncbi:hypothetical protein KI387_029558 [Taxus chinensis]|uniref:Uncharacterized protein n=1 Tax=Taxus chinensis TaxID=29808 RepID=A0AA38CAH0_TAXCH|nr:hypothetical protein KI387_029558 [Taxus chinensis]